MPPRHFAPNYNRRFRTRLVDPVPKSFEGGFGKGLRKGNGRPAPQTLLDGASFNPGTSVVCHRLLAGLPNSQEFGDLTSKEQRTCYFVILHLPARRTSWSRPGPRRST